MKLLSALGGGLWLIPLVLFIAGIYSAYKAYKQRESGFTQQTLKGNITGKEKVPYIKIGAFWYAVVLISVSVVVFLIMQNEK